MRRLEFHARRLYRRFIQAAGSHFYANPDTDTTKSILVAGSARSGTTWLGDFIAAQIPCRIMFEPFNPDLVREYRDFYYFQYMRPERQNNELYAFSRKVFTGEIRNRWIDHQNEQLRPHYRLIKEIRANLMLKWLHGNFTEVPIIFLLRHPCAVVLSRMELGWGTDSDIQPLLSQPDLVQDYLGDHLEFIKAAKTEEEKHAIIWSITNLVPLKQFNAGGIKLMYYEYLCTQPDVELPSLLSFIGQSDILTSRNVINRPSQTTRASSPVVLGNDKLSNWKKKLSVSQIDNVLRVVERFGLSTLYSDSLYPLNGLPLS